MASDVIPPMNPEFETKAANIVEEIGVSKRDLYFVHIRRGDYNAWPSKEHPAIVPLRWYEQQISRIRELNPDAFFLVFSDDFWYVHDFFSGKDWARVCGEGHYIDFMLMAQCHGGGVLSASSYAWWAAYYARRENSEAYFVAPLYWAGHRLGKWYPECIETEWINYQPVS
ncbi:hypothetical protein GSbR_38080 [Geobacter sp. SVR]|nr:hypothetical protein GSVR_02850 [Geobacter sp. SVR]GCF87208.1 hypothetical protein GSbR_38080 [Geobacter sp. SVR]